MQTFIGIGRPDSLLTDRQRHAPLATVDVLAPFNLPSIDHLQANWAFQQILNREAELAGKAKREAGKRGLSQQEYEEVYWEEYLEHASKEDIDRLWEARSAPRYQLMWEMYQHLKAQPGDLLTFTEQTLKVFGRINPFLAIHISNEIANEIAKKKRDQKKITPAILFESLLQDHHCSAKQFGAIYKLATHSFAFKAQKNPHLVQLKKLL